MVYIAEECWLYYIMLLPLTPTTAPTITLYILPHILTTPITATIGAARKNRRFTRDREWEHPQRVKYAQWSAELHSGHHSTEGRAGKETKRPGSAEGRKRYALCKLRGFINDIVLKL